MELNKELYLNVVLDKLNNVEKDNLILHTMMLQGEQEKIELKRQIEELNNEITNIRDDKEKLILQLEGLSTKKDDDKKIIDIESTVTE